MKGKITQCIVLAATLGAVLGPGSATLLADNQPRGVYEYVVQKVEGSFDEAAGSLEAAAAEAGWEVVAALEAGTPEDCTYRARVLVLYDAAYARAMTQANPRTGPFAALDRVNIFQDENGTHVAVVNPHSINRTILMDDFAYDEIAGAHLEALREMVRSAVGGTPSQTQYGQMRKKGHIGKTMGVMAGGKFAGLIQEKARVQGGDLHEVAGRIRTGLGVTGEEWGMHLVYEVDLSELGVILLGTTGSSMEAKSFSIVGAGSDKSRKDFDCPGLAYAGAYPMEVVVMDDGGAVKVYMVDVMFRMKMYFEDAGKWAFMKNMGMPGSIDEDLRNQIEHGLKNM